jgi:hypothetical protein
VVLVAMTQSRTSPQVQQDMDQPNSMPLSSMFSNSSLKATLKKQLELTHSSMLFKQQEQQHLQLRLPQLQMMRCTNSTTSSLWRKAMMKQQQRRMHNNTPLSTLSHSNDCPDAFLAVDGRAKATPS